MKPLQMYFSLIIPIYNRPEEIDELLASLAKQDYTKEYEIVIIEDGSAIPCEHICRKYAEQLRISYYYKPNSGPGDSRNYGMRKAQGDYFIILDSDCIIPSGYLSAISRRLNSKYTDCFGGPDAALDSFSDVQKAINFTMTSFLTTGGVRGKNESAGKFQPRSFNMGLSKKAFEATGGFGNIHPGEDPDLTLRLWEMGFTTELFQECYVYHKRRIDWQKFYRQVNKFGKARPILDYWHPKYKKATFLFPSLFIIGFVLSILLALFAVNIFLFFYVFYSLVVFTTAAVISKSIKIGLLSVTAMIIQFYGYGIGYLESYFKVHILRNKPDAAFPELFFRP
jgi:glycosyltransferase involved in cell wall biosynthesis